MTDEAGLSGNNEIAVKLEENSLKRKADDDDDDDDDGFTVVKKLKTPKRKFNLLYAGYEAKLVPHPDKIDYILNYYEIQQLILSMIMPPPSLPFPWTWFKATKLNTVPRLAIFLIDFPNFSCEDCMPYFQHSFKFQNDHNWVAGVLNYTVTRSQVTKFEIKQEPVEYKKVIKFDGKFVEDEVKTDCLDLLLSPAQLLIEDFLFPRPISHIKRTTLKEYKPVTKSSPLFALDCEMCITTDGKSSLTRVSIVDEDLNCVYDTFVKPKLPIKDYLTRFSGITKKILDPVKTTLRDVRKKIREILPPDAILCGQSLSNDLKALKMFHPYVIDTSVIFNLTGSRVVKSGLKLLTKFFIGEDIQTAGKHGHCSIEDAEATMKLVKLKLKYGKNFGDAVIDRSFQGAKDLPVLPITTFCKMKNCDVKCFYDFVSWDEPKFISVFTTESDLLKTAIAKCLIDNDCSVLILNENGHCHLKI